MKTAVSGTGQPLFGGSDQEAKHDVWLRDRRSLREQIAYGLAATAHETNNLSRVKRLLTLAREGPGARRELFRLRCGPGLCPVIVEAVLPALETKTLPG